MSADDPKRISPRPQLGSAPLANGPAKVPAAARFAAIVSSSLSSIAMRRRFISEPRKHGALIMIEVVAGRMWSIER
jgi:hypothetical protein